MALMGRNREGGKICFTYSVTTDSIHNKMLKEKGINENWRLQWQYEAILPKNGIFLLQEKDENMEEGAKEHDLGWIFPLRMKSWKERLGKNRRGNEW